MYIGETGRRLTDHFGEHRRDVINGRNNDLSVPAHFNETNHTLEDMKAAVLWAGLANQEFLKKQEMRLILKYGTVGPRARRRALFHVARALVYNQARELISTNLSTVFSLVP